MNGMTRRDFGKRALTGVSSWAVCSAVNGSGLALNAQAAPIDRSGNRSLIGGVQFGLQPFCYHDLAMTPDNRGTLIKRLVQNGFGMVELHATWVEPRFADPGVRPEETREKQRAWRLSQPVDHYASVKREFDEAGITIFSYYVNINDTYTDAEIDAVFAGAKMLGAKGCVGSQGLALSKRLAAFPGKHGMFLGIHNHANLSDADAFATEDSFVKGLAFSPDVKATLDTRHFTAANGDKLFVESAGQADLSVPDVHVVETGTVTGGTGRFEGATGTIAIERVVTFTGPTTDTTTHVMEGTIVLPNGN